MSDENLDQPSAYKSVTNTTESTALPKPSELGESAGSTFVLLQCWYDGDSNLVDDSFIACGDIESLKKEVPPEAELFLPGEIVKDDGAYGDSRKRYRIIAAPLLSNAKDHR